MPLARSFREKLVRVPLDLDYPYWVKDDAFDLEFHVRQSAAGQTGHARSNSSTLANRLMSLPLDMSRPLWEAWFVEGLDAIEGVPPGSFALLIKMHHAAVDGVSGMEMVTALLEDEATADRADAEGGVAAGNDARTAQLLLKAIGANLKSPLKLTDALMRAVPVDRDEPQAR